MRIWSPKYLRNLKSMGQGSQCHGNCSVLFPPFLPRFPVPPRGQSCDISVHTNAQLSVFANPLQSSLHSSCWSIWKWTNPFCNRSVMNISRDQVWALLWRTSPPITSGAALSNLAEYGVVGCSEKELKSRNKAKPCHLLRNRDTASC